MNDNPFKVAAKLRAKAAESLKPASANPEKEPPSTGSSSEPKESASKPAGSKK